MGKATDKYRRKMIPYGLDVGDAYVHNSVAFMENAFNASPTYRRMGVKGTEYPELDYIDGRTIEVERMGSLREVLFRPLSAGLNVGAFLVFDNDTWLIFDRFGQNKVMVAQCNRTLKWIDRKGVLQTIDCIASASDLGSKAKQSKNEIEWNKYDVRMPLGQLFVFTELTEETSQIDLNDRFVFGSKVYEVTGTDETSTVNANGHGVLQLTVKLTTIRDQDDFKNQIAHNTYTKTVDPIVVIQDEEEGGLW